MVADNLNDNDISSYLGALIDDPVMAAVSAQGEVRSVLQAAQQYSEGSDMANIETLAETLSGSKIVKSTASQNGWAARKYTFVQQFCAPNLPEDPWSLVLQLNGLTECCAALAVAIKYVVYGNDAERTGCRFYADRRRPGSSLLLIASG